MRIDTRSFSLTEAVIAKDNNRTISNKTLGKVGIIAKRLYGVSSTSSDKAGFNKQAIQLMTGEKKARFLGLIEGVFEMQKAKNIANSSISLTPKAKKKLSDKLDQLINIANVQIDEYWGELEQPEELHTSLYRQYMLTMQFGPTAHRHKYTLRTLDAPTD